MSGFSPYLTLHAEGGEEGGREGGEGGGGEGGGRDGGGKGGRERSWHASLLIYLHTYLPDLKHSTLFRSKLSLKAILYMHVYI